jgi:hypothetical protein
MGKNSRLMTDVFGKRAVNTAEPDGAWPLPAELVGIEIEVENLQGDSGAAYPQWTVHEDHSLRNGIEFVTSGPVGGKLLTSTIRKFFQCGFKYDMTPRTSTHIHVNASDAGMTMDQFRNLFVIMYLIEPAVFRWADENRKWCGYCSPLTDMDPLRIVSILSENKNERQFIQSVQGTGNHDRYYGLNVAAFHKHGTLEFRYFPCTDSEAQLTEWVKFVLYVKAAAQRFDSPSDLLKTVSTRAGLSAFLVDYFGTVVTHIAGNLDHDDCVGRAKELLGLLDLTPEQIKAGESYKTHRSKGLTKLLAVTFPKHSVKDDAFSVAEARANVDKAYQAFADAIEGRSEASTKTTQLEYMNARAQLQRVEQLRAIQQAAAVEEAAPPRKKPAAPKKVSTYADMEQIMLPKYPNPFVR